MELIHGQEAEVKVGGVKKNVQKIEGSWWGSTSIDSNWKQKWVQVH